MSGKNKNKLQNHHSEIIKLFKEGVSYKDIAKKFNVTHNPIVVLLTKHGLWEPRRQKGCNLLSDVDASYLAGIIDGEGCVYAAIGNLQKCGLPSIRVILQIQMTSKPVIDWIVNKSGIGSVKQGKTPKGNITWYWTVSMRSAYPVLKQVVPFLILKKEQAELALELIETRRITCRTPNFDLKHQIEIVNKITKLKIISS